MTEDVELIKLLAFNAKTVYDSCLVGNPAPQIAERYQEIAHPKPGDLVLEVAVGVPDSSGAWKPEALGRLLRVTQERIDERSDEKWNEAEEGRPCPTEDCWYVRALATGREVRWTNCTFIKVLEPHRRRKSPGQP